MLPWIWRVRWHQMEVWILALFTRNCVDLMRFFTLGSAFLPSSALLMVTSPNQSSSNKRHMIGSNLTSKSVSIPVSLASLASNGGVVTLAGTWNNNKKPSFASGASDRNMFVQAKQVQIKVVAMIVVPALVCDFDRRCRCQWCKVPDRSR